MYAKRIYRKKTGPKRAYKKRTSKGVTMATKRYVKREIHRNIENKQENLVAHRTAVQPYINNNSCNVFSAISYSQINLGLGEGDRIGTVIRTRKLQFNYVLYPSGQNTDNNPSPRPQEVIIFIGKVKNSKPLIPVSSDFAKLFQAGDTTLPPQDNMLDILMQVNSNWFTCYKTIRHKVGFATYGGSSILTNNTQMFYHNNDFKLNCRGSVNLTKYCPKVLKFNDGSLQPTNDGLFIWTLTVQSDGVDPPVNFLPVHMDFTLQYVYEDA